MENEPKSITVITKSSNQKQRKSRANGKGSGSGAGSAGSQGGTTRVAIVSKPAVAPQGSPTAKGQPKKNARKRAARRPLGTGLFSAQAEATIAQLMMQLAFPDIYDPPVLGIKGAIETVPHKLRWEFMAPWSSLTAGIAQRIPPNELFAIVLTKHSCCSLIYAQVTGGVTRNRDFISGNGSAPAVRVGQWINPAYLNRDTPSATGMTVEPVFQSDDPDEGTMVWLGSSASIVISYTGAPLLGASGYSLAYVRRIGNYFETGISTYTPGSSVSIGTWSFGAPGYYCFMPVMPVNSAAWPGIVPVQVRITETFTNGEYVIQHEQLPSSITTSVESTRINAARITMTNFSGPFNAEGGAISTELSTYDRWDEILYSGGNPASSPFSILMNMPDSYPIENSQGISGAPHPDLDAEPVDNQAVSGVTIAGANVINTPRLSDICGGQMVVVRTGLTNTAARDGVWAVTWATESESSSQLWNHRTPDYPPFITQEAADRFKRFRTISHNPDHFRKGIAALRQIANTGEKVGNALIDTGVGAPLGGAITAGSRFLKKIF